MPSYIGSGLTAGVNSTLASAITLDGQIGETVRGECKGLPGNSGQRGDKLTWLTWPEDGGAILCQGQDHELSSFLLCGIYYSSDPRQAPEQPEAGTYKSWSDAGHTYHAVEPMWPDKGIVLSHTAGLGSGRISCRDVNIYGYRTGVQIGTAAGDAQCAESDWKSMWFVECHDQAIKIINLQAIGHTFKGIRANGCPTIFEVNGGGKFTCENIFTATSGARYFHLNPLEGSVGHNNCFYTLRDFWTDTQTTNPVFLHLEDYDYQHGSLVLQRVKTNNPWNWTTPAFNLSGRISVSIYDMDWITPGMFEWHNQNGFITDVNIFNSRIYGTDRFACFEANTAISHGQIDVTMWNCKEMGTGQPNFPRKPYYRKTFSGTA